MIGNREHAQMVLRSNDFLFSTEGSTRYVHLIEGVIYKVGIYGPAENRAEFNKANSIRDLLPAGIYIPEMSLFEFENDIVLASEFVDGLPSGECSKYWTDENFCADEGICIPDQILDQLISLGWSDSCWGNAINCEGVIYLVDLAC